ncbi:DNA-binding protein BIN4-like [Ipomoea triloba]|uniref:DNA-binding protein BIN4-like n=1 Tax=Ipomoea triloba TaxID=35885 RepID=UPI00125D69AA|nr:DNA-binding protein BIN4-like [Ipomoea triloba]XP_031124459.1 DNA-binding protein BIN4-like [Ipomoea triloba]XP_031124460.1 DNA-binding protein BIN4-like [Ipomoea triloba]XP_031124461.1 DNA-binding protein BIN4-like [Ipomoea triloba]XP_031124463.1 DNA-binding protein BIN4-like [Ipomoea triloba]
MSTSREESPDWLRSFKAPTPLALSSDSESPSNDSPISDDEDGMSLGKLFSKDKSNTIETKNNLDGNDLLIYTPSREKSPAKKARVEHTPGGKRKRESQPENEGKDDDDFKVFSKRKATEKFISHEEPIYSVWSLSSDSKSYPDTSPIRKGHILDKDLLAHNEAQDMKSKGTKDPDFLDSDGEPVSTEDLKMKSPKKQSEKDNHTPKKRKKVEKTTNEDAENKANADVLEEDIPEKHNGTHVSYSRLPLLLPEKVQRLKALVECDGDSIDLSGDVGAVGRVVISDNPSGSNEMLLDLKGTIYKTTIVPSMPFCVVSFGPSEAKIDAIMNELIQLTPQSNVYEAETMVEGTLDGFSFDSEEEADNLPKKAVEGNQNEAIEDETNGKTERKAKKSLGAEQKKGKIGGGKQPKKAKKKAQVTKKNKKK